MITRNKSATAVLLTTFLLAVLLPPMVAQSDIQPKKIIPAAARVAREQLQSAKKVFDQYRTLNKTVEKAGPNGVSALAQRMPTYLVSIIASKPPSFWQRYSILIEIGEKDQELIRQKLLTLLRAEMTREKYYVTRDAWGSMRVSESAPANVTAADHGDVANIDAQSLAAIEQGVQIVPFEGFPGMFRIEVAADYPNLLDLGLRLQNNGVNIPDANFSLVGITPETDAKKIKIVLAKKAPGAVAIGSKYQISMADTPRSPWEKGPASPIGKARR